MVEPTAIARGGLTLLRFILFALTLGLTLISFQAYRKRGTQRLQYAFLGFAFTSMGVAILSVITQLGAPTETSTRLFFEFAETLPFIIGFAMLYLSLYRG